MWVPCYQMKLMYFVSSGFDYGTVIYAGVGPRFAQPFGWPVAPIRTIMDAPCDVGLIDGRLTGDDLLQLDEFLSLSPARRFPVFFRLSDPDMPTYTRESDLYGLRKKDYPGVHYMSLYDPAGPLLEFTQSLKRSQVVRISYPYDLSREIDTAFCSRRRQVFLSGQQNKRLYPLRHTLHQARASRWLARLAVTELPHPGYADIGRPRKHEIVHERFIRHAAQFTHFFLCPSRYRVELMKYIECGYAGCVPIGEPPDSLKHELGHCLLPYTGRTTQLLKAVSADRHEMMERAGEYRRIMRRLRDPATLNAALEDQIRTVI